MKSCTLLPWIFAYVLATSSFGQQANANISSKIERILADHSDYEFEGSMAWQAEVLDLMRDAYGNEHLLREVEKVMADFMSSDATYAAKKKVWMDFANIVSAQSLPTLVKMLDSDETSPLAMLIIQKADPKIEDALVAQLPEMPDAKVITIIHHFADNKNHQAVDLLQRYTQSDNKQIARSAFGALAKIGTPASADILLEVFNEMEEPIDGEVYNSLLKGAEQLVLNGYKNQASALYTKLADSDAPAPFHSAALYGLFKHSDDPVTFIRAHLSAAEPEIRPQIIRMVKDLPNSFSEGDELLRIEDLSAADRAQLLLILTGRSDPSIRLFTIEALESNDSQLSNAALKALPNVARSSDVDWLLDLAVDASEDNRELIVDALASISENEVDEKVSRYMQEAESERLLVLMETAEKRYIPAVVDTLFHLVQHEDRKVRLKAFKTLETVGDHRQIARALAFLTQADSRFQRRAWERTIYRLAFKNPDDSLRSSEIVAKLNEVKDNANIASLILILGEIGSPADFSQLQRFLQHADRSIRIRTIEALSKWPNSDPQDDLIREFRKSEDKDIRLAALRGSTRLLDEDRSASRSEKLELIGALMEDAQNASEIAVVIAAYGEVENIASLKILVSLMNESTNSAAAEKSIREIMRDVYSDDKKQARAEILKAKELSSNQEFREWVDEGLRKERF